MGCLVYLTISTWVRIVQENFENPIEKSPIQEQKRMVEIVEVFFRDIMIPFRKIYFPISAKISYILYAKIKKSMNSEMAFKPPFPPLLMYPSQTKASRHFKCHHYFHTFSFFSGTLTVLNFLTYLSMMCVRGDPPFLVSGTSNISAWAIDWLSRLWLNDMVIHHEF